LDLGLDLNESVGFWHGVQIAASGIHPANAARLTFASQVSVALELLSKTLEATNRIILVTVLAMITHILAYNAMILPIVLAAYLNVTRFFPLFSRMPMSPFRCVSIAVLDLFLGVIHFVTFHFASTGRIDLSTALRWVVLSFGVISYFHFVIFCAFVLYVFFRNVIIPPILSFWHRQQN
jgi:hypothetical protein